MKSDFIKRHREHFKFRSFVTNALKEDLGDGDHTTLSTVSKDHRGKMQLLVKQSGIIAGIEAAELILHHVDKSLRMKTFIKDGASVKKGDVAFTIEGNVRKLLSAERLVLNTMQRMSGIATKTHNLQQLCAGTTARVIDTRKTTPGFRLFEKWAVVIGGGANHRFGLSDMILIKDNHVDFAGGIPRAIDAARAYMKRKDKPLKMEVEARNLEDVKQIIRHKGVHRIMLDNFSPAQTQKAVKLINGKFEVESSGGITEANIAAYARCGVDFISIGALTHHVKSLDMSLKAVK